MRLVASRCFVQQVASVSELFLTPILKGFHPWPMSHSRNKPKWFLLPRKSMAILRYYGLTCSDCIILRIQCYIYINTNTYTYNRNSLDGWHLNLNETNMRQGLVYSFVYIRSGGWNRSPKWHGDQIDWFVQPGAGNKKKQIKDMEESDDAAWDQCLWITSVSGPPLARNRPLFKKNRNSEMLRAETLKCQWFSPRRWSVTSEPLWHPKVSFLTAGKV